MHLARRTVVIGGAGGALACMTAQAAVAHGDNAPAPTVATIFTAWSGDLLPWIGIGLATAGYLVAVRMVNAAHPRNPVPRLRVAAWLAGLAALAIALLSAVDVYADSVFTDHMVQHLLLAMVAPPLLALGAPVTLALRVVGPRGRRRLLLPILHSRLARAVGWPPVGWVAFSVVMWATHFTPLFNAALEDGTIHVLEHLLYLASGLLFWWPIVGADPAPWRLPPLVRAAYLGVQMPVNTAVGLAIYFAPNVLYAHYAGLARTWGPDPLTDQQVAGVVMWGAGDVILLGALILAIMAWLRAEERRGQRAPLRVGIEERAGERS